MKKSLLITLTLLFAVVLVGCPSASDTDGHGADGPATTDGGEDGAEPHGHSHADADALTWKKKDLDHEGYKIKLGLHGPHLHQGEAAEVAVEIKKGEEFYGDAIVYVTLLDGDAENVLDKEKETTYEPTTPEEDGHYAQAELAIPADARQVTVRYRIKFTDAAEFSSDVLMATE